MKNNEMFIKFTGVKFSNGGTEGNGNLYVMKDQIVGFGRDNNTRWISNIFLKGGQTIPVNQSVREIKELLGLE